MTQYMDKNIMSEQSNHLRLLVYYSSQIISEETSEKAKQSYIEKFNKEVEHAIKRNLWTPYTKW